MFVYLYLINSSFVFSFFSHRFKFYSKWKKFSSLFFQFHLFVVYSYIVVTLLLLYYYCCCFSNNIHTVKPFFSSSFSSLWSKKNIFLWWFFTIPRRLHTHMYKFWFGRLLLLALLLLSVYLFTRVFSVTHMHNTHCIESFGSFRCLVMIDGMMNITNVIHYVCVSVCILLLLHTHILCGFDCK